MAKGGKHMSFNENLKEYRERSGYTAKEFAKIIDLPYTTYISYENQGREPKYDVLIKIAAALHVSIDDLLGYDPDQPDEEIKYFNLLREYKIPMREIKANGKVLYCFDVPGTNTTIALGIKGLKKCWNEAMEEFKKETSNQFKNIFLGHLVWTYEYTDGDTRLKTDKIEQHSDSNNEQK